MSFPVFLAEISTVLSRQDGNQLADLLRPQGVRAASLLKAMDDTSVRAQWRRGPELGGVDISAATSPRPLSQKFDVALGRHCHCLCTSRRALCRGDVRTGIRCTTGRCEVSYLQHTHLAGCDDCSGFLRFFATTTGWCLPTLYAILVDLRDLAYKAGRSVPYRTQLLTDVGQRQTRPAFKLMVRSARVWKTQLVYAIRRSAIA